MLPETNLSPSAILLPLIDAITKLGTLELLQVNKFEDEYVKIKIKLPKEANDSNANMNKLCIRKRREEFRTELRKGAPMPNIMLCTHYFNNNEPSVWLIFKVDPDKCDQHLAEGVRACGAKTPIIMNNHQIKKVKESIDLMKNIKFTRKSAKVNCIISAISNGIDTNIQLPTKYEEDIKREIDVMQVIDDMDLLKSCILGNKMIYGGETKYEEFIKIVNKKLSLDPAIDSRRSNDKVCISKYVSARALLQEILVELPPHCIPPSLSWLELQFAPNDMRYAINQKHCGRIDMVR